MMLQMLLAKKMYIDKIGIVILTSLLFILPGATSTNLADYNENVVSIYYSFADPVIEIRTIQNALYTDIHLIDTITDGKPGQPSLPIKGAYILLPPDTTIDVINVDLGDEKVYYLDHPILPGEIPVPLSESDKEISLFVNKSIYSGSDMFPTTLYSVVGVYHSHGYTILVLEINPLQYQPTENKVFFYPAITLEVRTKPVLGMESMIRSNTNDRNDILTMVDNPDDIRFYDDSIILSCTLDDETELLIITTDELKDAFKPLKQAHDAENIKTSIVTLADIGSDDPGDIRDYIKEMYQTKAVRYVLLGGDDDVVPVRYLFVSGMDENITYYEDYMPSDLYYACLDGSFNGDGDDSWGEPTDGENGGDVDLFSEISVGRACVSTVDEAELFVQKTLSFMNEIDESYRNKVLFVGEKLGNYGIATYAGNYLDQFFNSSSDDGYKTQGFPTELYDIQTVYDRDGSWSKEELASYINNGVGIINHLGHSNYVYNIKMSYSDIDILNNEKLCFVYSQGCMAGGFDGKDCFAEYMTVKQPYGAAAGIWNARYGWFWTYRTDGDSQRYHREFWDAVFGETIPTIGEANHDSKEDNIYLVGRSCMRWTMYELNLFGDPTLAFYCYRPLKPETPQGPTSGVLDESYVYTSRSTDPNNDLLYYQWGTDDRIISDWIGPYDSGELCNFTMTWNEQGTYLLQVRVKDEAGYTSAWSDPLEITMPKTRGLIFILKDIFLLFFDSYPFLNIYS